MINPTINHQPSIDYLQQPNLMQRTMNDLQALGIRGEQENSLILYLAMTSRKYERPLSVVCQAHTGTGKNYLVNRIAGCMPAGEVDKYLHRSAASLYYNGEALQNKVCIVDDLDIAGKAVQALMQLNSHSYINKAIAIQAKGGRFKAVTQSAEGAISLIVCTDKKKVSEKYTDNALLISLDGSREQDGRVMAYQKEVRAGIVNKAAEQQMTEKLQAVQAALKPVKVVNPYAQLIQLPPCTRNPRQALPMLLSFIETITFYNQHQREHKTDKATKETYIETTPQDIYWAFKLLQNVLTNHSDELSDGCRKFYEWLRGWAAKDKKSRFYANEIRKITRISPRTLQRYLAELADYGRIKRAGGNKYSGGYQYSLEPGQAYTELCLSVEQHIAGIMQQVHEAHVRSQVIVTPKQEKGEQAAGQCASAPLCANWAVAHSNAIQARGLA